MPQVNFPADWKVTGDKADAILALLKRIPAEKKEASADKSWYHDLTDAQIAQCVKNPNLFVVRPLLCPFYLQHMHCTMHVRVRSRPTCVTITLHCVRSS